MKNEIKVMILIILFLPFIVYARTYTYNKGIQEGNAFINESKFDSRNKYLIFNNSRFIMDNNGFLSYDNNFIYGGFLNYREFCISTGSNSCDKSSYLVIPSAYWTSSGPTSTNRYYINNINGIAQKSDNNPSNVRVTEFVKPETTVIGNGSFSDPWYFYGNYYVSITTNSIKYAYFGPEDNKKNKMEKYAGTSCVLGSGFCVNFDITQTHGYENKNSDGCNLKLVNRNGRVHKYEISNITNDIECVAIFGKKEFTVSFNCSPGLGTIESKKVLYDTNLVIPSYECSRTGYTQIGWKTGDNDNWTENSTIKFHFDDGEKGIDNKILDLKANYQANTFNVQYNGNGNTGGSVSSHTCTYDEDCTLKSNGFTRTYYKFKGWKLENSGDSLAEGASIKNASTGATITYYAQWELDAVNCAPGTYLKANTFTCSSCPAGKYCVGGTYVFGNPNDQGITGNCNAGRYSTGGASAATCTACPSGYTSNAGATADTSCYMSVPGGKYLTAKASSATNCPEGQFRSGTVTKYYGQSVGCANCNANTYSTGGASSCTGCPSGYGVAAGAGKAQSSCYINVPAGRYLNARASSTTLCPKNTWRSGGVNINYGGSIGCTGCASNYYTDGQGNTSSSACKACNRWELTNSVYPVLGQKWKFYRDCREISGSYDGYTVSGGNGWFYSGGTVNFPDNDRYRWSYYENGYMKVGWLNYGGDWYYLNEETKDCGGYPCPSGMLISGNGSSCQYVVALGERHVFDSMGRWIRQCD